MILQLPKLLYLKPESPLRYKLKDPFFFFLERERESKVVGVGGVGGVQRERERESQWMAPSQDSEIIT